MSTYTSDVVRALQARAKMKSLELGHRLSTWHPAKKKHGPGSLKSACTVCGMSILVLPQVPSMQGDALFDTCVRKVWHV
jgi:hypothetical protein